MQNKLKRRSNIEGIAETYRGMNDKQLEREADELSNMIYALLTVTDCKSIEVEFDHALKIEMKITPLKETKH